MSGIMAGMHRENALALLPRNGFQDEMNGKFLDTRRNQMQFVKEVCTHVRLPRPSPLNFFCFYSHIHMQSNSNSDPKPSPPKPPRSSFSVQKHRPNRPQAWALLVGLLSHRRLALGGRSVSGRGVALGLLAQKLVLGLLVAVHDELVEEAAGLAVGLVFLGLGALDFAVQVAGGLLVEVVGVVEVGWGWRRRGLVRVFFAWGEDGGREDERFLSCMERARLTRWRMASILEVLVLLSLVVSVCC